jgi:hypothetical protein
MFYADSYHLDTAPTKTPQHAKAMALEATEFYWISSTTHNLAITAEQH